MEALQALKFVTITARNKGQKNPSRPASGLRGPARVRAQTVFCVFSFACGFSLSPVPNPGVCVFVRVGYSLGEGVFDAEECTEFETTRFQSKLALRAQLAKRADKSFTRHGVAVGDSRRNRVASSAQKGSSWEKSTKWPRAAPRPDLSAL